MRPIVLALLPGDGIGPEVMAQAVKLLEPIGRARDIEFEINEADFGGIAIDRHGCALPDETLRVCSSADAVLLGSVGGAKWDSLPPEERPERAGLLPLRQQLGLYANLRAFRVFPQLASASPLRGDLLQDGLDLLIVRELTGGIYFGTPRGREGDRAFDTLVYTEQEIRRIAATAFEQARSRSRRLTSVDKANVLASMVLWREIVEEVGREYPDVELTHMYVDNAAMQLIQEPSQFDVLLCGNMFGDILSDEASVITGSLGMLPSASLSSREESNGSFGLYEPAGGSAPDIAGMGVANPIAQILSLAMLFRFSLKLPELHDAIFRSVERVLEAGYRTRDIAAIGDSIIGTSEMGDRIVEELAGLLDVPN